MPIDTTNTGYLRYPAVRGDTIAFVSEDDIWTVPASGGVARRLTTNLGPVGSLAISPDGERLAFTGSEEAHMEVYVMPADGGQARRVTYLGAMSAVRGWTDDGRIVFASDAGQPFNGHHFLYTVDPDSSTPEPIEVGPAHTIGFGPGGGVVIGRHTVDPARWKRYRGGTAGVLWVDRRGDGNFKRVLADLDTNIGSPMWVGERIFFISDHEGIGNVYSITPAGSDLRRHTDHGEYYARWASTDGERIVYQHAAEIWLLDPEGDPRRVDVDLRSPRVQRNRRFVDASRFLHGGGLHPKGHSMTIEARGKLFAMPLWEEAVRQYGRTDGVRYRLPRYNHDGSAVVAVSDDGGQEGLEVYEVDDPTTMRRLEDLDLGRIVEMVPSPAANLVAVATHRLDAAVVNLDDGTVEIIDRSSYDRINGLAWSPDGRWLAYSYAATHQTRSIKLWDSIDRRTHFATSPSFRDMRPSFDPEGRYLYFLSYRTFDPVYDQLFFEISFPRAVRPYLVTLRADVPDPFVPRAKGFGEKDGPEDKDKKDKKKSEGPPAVQIDLEGITNRIVAFPMPESRYTQVWGVRDKVFFLNHPIEGSLGATPFDTDDEPKGTIEVYDLRKLEQDTFARGASSFVISEDGSTLLYRSRRRLRALDVNRKPEPKQDKEGPGRRSGWIDLGRVRPSVDPGSEWVQMQREAWRFQLDHFWAPDMSGVDWQRVYERYRPLVDKVTTRYEFSDLMWEMLGELGTSHAYDVGGDVRPAPPYPVGHLGADLTLNRRSGRWVFSHIVRGDSWEPAQDSPLNAPGVNVKEGDTLLAVNGQPVTPGRPPATLLVNQAGQTVELTVADARGRNRRTVLVRTLSDERPVRYREWVETNRRHVHEATNGRVGYIHIPNMGPQGYSEFHRSFLPELDREGLIVDVRFNGGGHVSQLLLEKLARQRIGYDVPRWGVAEPYPSDSPAGPLVCITNERAGSDGDIFSHCFKLMGIGPVVGKRTWGGVIGISVRHQLADNGITTQPEYAFWFSDVGWGVENYGTDPDHDVDIRPQDHVAGRDPQMDKALQLVQAALRKHKPETPDMKRRPDLALPKLPARGVTKATVRKKKRR